MRLLLRMVLLFLAGMTAGETRAAVEVELRHPVSEGGGRLDNGNGVIEVVVTNTGKQAVFIDPWTLPGVSSRSGMLRDNLFQVTSPSGVTARYRGPLPARDAEPANYKELPPARSIVYRVSIALSYDVSVEGVHRVEFSGVRYLRNHRESYTGLTASMVSGVMLEAGTGEVVDLYLSPALTDEAYVRSGQTAVTGDRGSPCRAGAGFSVKLPARGSLAQALASSRALAVVQGGVYHERSESAGKA